ncbi:MAG: 4Fe-4S ferredoxin [Deltaproteobacteria bacterium]|nr:4Fe-4S ferredoxin [Deltaproteobacteria bacterium]MBW2132111.1 4Fe-4S ferredoxin [Deltaproteobacteria bacterium]
MAKVTILTQMCKGLDDCGICRYVCPERLFEASREMNASGYFPPELTRPEDCTGCQTCMICCPDFAIVVETEEKQTYQNTEEEHGAEQ